MVIVGAGWIGLEVAAAARTIGCEVDGRRAAGAAAAGRDGRADRIDLRRPAPRARRGPPARGVGRGGREGPGAGLRRRGAARRSRGRRRRCRTPDSLAESAGPRDRQRRARGRPAADVRPARVRRGRHRQPRPPGPGTPGPRGALGQRDRAGQGRGPERCSARTWRTSGRLTSSPISTTSAWSTSATRPRRTPTAWPCAATWRSVKGIVVWHDAGRVVAAMHVNEWDATGDLKALLGRTIDVGRFEDASVALSDLSAEAADQVAGRAVAGRVLADVLLTAHPAPRRHVDAGGGVGGHHGDHAAGLDLGEVLASSMTGAGRRRSRQSSSRSALIRSPPRGCPATTSGQHGQKRVDLLPRWCPGSARPGRCRG